MIKKIFKALFCKNNFSTEWRKRNSHNFTIPATNFKMDAVQVGKGTYGVSVSAILSCRPFFILIFLPCIKMNHYGFSRKSIWKNLETFP